MQKTRVGLKADTLFCLLFAGFFPFAKLKEGGLMDAKITVSDLRELAKAEVSSYPFKTRLKNWWQKPLLVTARADTRFQILPEIAYGEHLLPWELLPSAKTVIVFFIPFIKELIDENSSGKFPCRNWGLAYEATNALIGILAEKIKDHLAERGAPSALTPATHNFDPIKLVSRWSHKHLGYLCGLGRFGVNAQLITPSGCGGRLGSLVTTADLGDNFLVESRELCLHKTGNDCLKCVKQCPVGALSEDGIDRHRCFRRLRLNLSHTEALAGLAESTHVCGKCVVNLPCSMNPLDQQQ